MFSQWAKLWVLTIILLMSTFAHSSAFEIKSKYTTIIYNNKKELRQFNNDIYMGKYSRILLNNNVETSVDELIVKIDWIVDRVKSILKMSPEKIGFKIAICPSSEAVIKAYKIVYGKDTRYKAFYAPQINTVFFSTTDMELRVVAHEFAHVIMEHYFQTSPPKIIHELLARYAEKHITD